MGSSHANRKEDGSGWVGAEERREKREGRDRSMGMGRKGFWDFRDGSKGEWQEVEAAGEKEERERAVEEGWEDRWEGVGGSGGKGFWGFREEKERRERRGWSEREERERDRDLK